MHQGSIILLICFLYSYLVKLYWTTQTRIAFMNTFFYMAQTQDIMPQWLKPFYQDWYGLVIFIFRHKIKPFLAYNFFHLTPPLWWMNIYFVCVWSSSSNKKRQVTFSLSQVIDLPSSICKISCIQVSHREIEIRQ